MFCNKPLKLSYNNWIYTEVELHAGEVYYGEYKCTLHFRLFILKTMFILKIYLFIFYLDLVYGGLQVTVAFSDS